MAELEKRPKDWPAVLEAIAVRMAELDMSQAELHRLSGLSENTLRNLVQKHKSAPSTLVLMAAILRWPYPFDHLRNILNGEAHKNERPAEESSESDESVPEERFREFLQDDLRQVKEDIGELRVAFDRMDEKVDSIMRIMRGRSPGSGPAA